MSDWRQDAHALCEAHGVSLEDVRSKRRLAKIVKARSAIAIMLRARTDHTGRLLSYPVIGRLLSKDHTSIQYMCKPHMRMRHRTRYAQIKEAA